MEMTTKEHVILFGIGLLLIAIGISGTCSPRVSAQHVHARELLRLRGTAGQDMSPAVVLARVCVKEAGFEAFATNDCAGIWTVLDRVGRGDVVNGAKQYSPRAFLPERLGGKPWIAYLRGDGAEPEGWPANLRWERYRGDWMELLRHAAELVAHGSEVCPAHHWGDRRGDHERAVSYGWRELDCGETANMFWVNPRRLLIEGRLTMPAALASGSR